jgi:hypothetical protein
MMGIIISKLINDRLPMTTSIDQKLLSDIKSGMAPGALGEQFNHSTDLRIALNQDDISFSNHTVETVHVVYHGPLIIHAGGLKSTE